MLCRIFKVNRPDLVTLTPERTRSHTDAVNRLREIFSDDTTGSVKGKLFEEASPYGRTGTALMPSTSRNT